MTLIADLFTFQYGYSKTFLSSFTSSFFATFTFQYGYSKTNCTRQVLQKHKNLHSSMVIVKLLAQSEMMLNLPYLHSSMVIVKPITNSVSIISIIYLHSSMVIVKRCKR